MNRFNLYCGSLLSLGCVIAVSSCKTHDKPTESQPVRVEVMVINPELGGFSANGCYSGTVVSDEESVVSFSVPGTITHIYVEEGQAVAKGQKLAQVKTESLNDERNIAVAELEQVCDLYNRLKILHDQNALPEVKWVEVQAKLKQAENAVSLANRAVSDATITAPISGYVSEKLADEGQSVIPAQPIMKIVNINNPQIAISVPENDVNTFKKGLNAKVTFDALDGMSTQGTLTSKEIVADPLTRSYKVKFDLARTDGKILPGMIGNVYLEKNEQKCDSACKNAIYIVPSQAVQLSSDNRQFVWLVKSGKARRQYVKANELRSTGIAIEDGLTVGDSLIVAGMQKVGTGTVVEPILGQHH
ncbi:MAG: efflux RND transporter periplasmic adaptor subunit [Duncaniella sp.]|nr:efflux RND transporter periplasmic adaptor subunit [Duncaniella sp.]